MNRIAKLASITLGVVLVSGAPKRARASPDGWLRIGDATYAMRATEVIADEERIPMLEKYGAKHNMSMDGGRRGETSWV